MPTLVYLLFIGRSYGKGIQGVHRTLVGFSTDTVYKICFHYIHVWSNNFQMFLRRILYYFHKFQNSDTQHFQIWLTWVLLCNNLYTRFSLWYEILSRKLIQFLSVKTSSQYYKERIFGTPLVDPHLMRKIIAVHMSINNTTSCMGWQNPEYRHHRYLNF